MAADFETVNYDIGGVQTVVKVIGSGKPVLFLHGASTLEGFDFATGLADRFRVYCPSHPGMGYSGDAPHVADVADFLVHYLNLLDALDLEEKPHLIGFSMGGWLATELAAIARERFDKVALIAPAGLNDPAHPAVNVAAIPAPEFPAYLAHNVAVALRYFPDGSDPDAASTFAAARDREGEMVARLFGRLGLGRPNLRRFLARITNPTLVVWGDQDRMLPCEQASLWVDALPDGQLLIVPGAGHLVAQERPGALKEIGDFLVV